MEAVLRAFFAAMLICAAAAGPAFAETRQVDVRSLRSLHVEGPFDVVASPGAPSAVLEGDADDLARVGVEQTADGLRVWRKCTAFCNDRGFDVTLRVTAPDLSNLHFAKGVDAKITGSTAPQMAIDIAMGVDLAIAGTCDALRAKAAMGASLSARDLVCRTVDVQAAMGADARVHATASVNAKASMGASIEVAGRPAERNADAGMGGSIDTD